LLRPEINENRSMTLARAAVFSFLSLLCASPALAKIKAE